MFAVAVVDDVDDPSLSSSIAVNSVLGAFG